MFLGLEKLDNIENIVRYLRCSKVKEFVYLSCLVFVFFLLFNVMYL